MVLSLEKHPGRRETQPMPFSQLAEPGATDRVAEALLSAAMAGAAELSRVCTSSSFWRKAKPDGSDVTEADMASDVAIRAKLAELLPHVAVISEESPNSAYGRHEFILVDPLDGTAEFLDGGKEYCVAVGYVIDGRALAGAIVAPMIGRAWWAGTRAFEGSFTPAAPSAAALTDIKPIKALQGRLDHMVALVSRLHPDARSQRAMERMKPSTSRPVSSAIKFGLIASAEAQFHIRCGPTMEWDVAAGDAILKASGGMVTDLSGAPLTYGLKRRGFKNPPFVAAAGSRVMSLALEALTS
jgi:3'(2'), 5'-bisphosphate nucleotidase